MKMKMKKKTKVVKSVKPAKEMLEDLGRFWFAGASTITNASTFEIAGPPLAPFRLNQTVYSNDRLVGRFKGSYGDKIIVELLDGRCEVYPGDVDPPIECYQIELTDSQFNALYTLFGHMPWWDFVVKTNGWKYLSIWIDKYGPHVSASNENEDPVADFEKVVLILAKGMDSKIERGAD